METAPKITQNMIIAYEFVFLSRPRYPAELHHLPIRPAFSKIKLYIFGMSS